MTQEAEHLAQTIERLELMNEALRHLRTEVLPKNPRMFAPKYPQLSATAMARIRNEIP